MKLVINECINQLQSSIWQKSDLEKDLQEKQQQGSDIFQAGGKKNIMEASSG